MALVEALIEQLQAEGVLPPASIDAIYDRALSLALAQTEARATPQIDEALALRRN